LRGFDFAAPVLVMVADEFEFCADTTSPALIKPTTAKPRMKRQQMVLFLTFFSFCFNHSDSRVKKVARDD
jgi:hypothetical protein